MNSEDLYRDITAYCKANYNALNIKKYSRYFKGEYNAYGLGQIQINTKAKELAKNRDIILDVIFETAPLLFKSGKYEEISFVLMLINERDQLYSKETLTAIEHLFEIGIYNWAHADTLAMKILPKFIKMNIAGNNYFEKWVKSDFKFQRRCVPVTLIKSIKMTASIDDLLLITEPLMYDTEREVHQGMGWFLRKSWESFPSETENFLMRYKNTAARLIFQLACEKMNKEDKLKFRKNIP